MQQRSTHSLGNNLKYLFRRCVACSRLLIPLLLLYALLEALLPLLVAYLPKIALQLLEENATIGRAIAVVAVFTLLLCAAKAAHGSAGACYWLVNNVRIEWMQELFLQNLSCPYRKVESAQGQLLYRQSMSDLDSGDWCSTTLLIRALTSLSSSLLGFMLYTSALSQFSPLVIVMLVFSSLLTVICPWLYMRFIDRYKERWQLLNKKLDYIRTQSFDQALGKDVRMYNMQKWLIDVRDEYLKKRAEWDRRMQNRTFAAQLVNLLVLLLRDGVAYGYLILQALRGRIALPDVALYVGLIAGFSQWVTGIVTQLTNVIQYNRRLADVRAFEDYLPQDAPNGTCDLPDGPLSIELDDVSFTYPGADKPTLEHLTFTIQAGEKIALVGVNGAGKTTLVKLLCGFYTPTTGTIRMNGRDLQQIDPEKLMDTCAAVFQDVLVLPFSIAENVAMKRPDQIDRERVAMCLKKAGLYERIQSEHKGIDTAVTRIMDPNGIQFSGGEAQKLLLARALYKEGRFLLLDEPTAALDPIAESEQYQQYFELGKEQTAIFISHRLASTRFCNRILFLDGGRITESGTHEELMALGGAYAKMYDVQSRYYRKGGWNAYEGSESEVQFASGNSYDLPV